MNSYQKLLRKRKILNLVRYSNRIGSHINCIKLSPNNSWEHEKKKIEVCWNLLKENKQFLTEAIFMNGKRCDILNITDGIIIEVLHTETIEEFKEKIKSYPDDLEATYVLSGEGE